MFGNCEVLKVLNLPKCFIYKHICGFRYFHNFMESRDENDSEKVEMGIGKRWKLGKRSLET